MLTSLPVEVATIVSVLRAIAEIHGKVTYCTISIHNISKVEAVLTSKLYPPFAADTVTFSTPPSENNDSLRNADSASSLELKLLAQHGDTKV